MKDDFGALLVSSLMKPSSSIVAAISFSSALLFWIFKPDENVPLLYVVIIIFFALISITTLFEATRISFSSNEIELPRIIDSKRDQAGNILCVLEPSILFSHGIVVSFYYINGNFEIYIGSGQVILIQRDGKIQVILDIPIQGYNEILEGFGNNNENIKKDIYIKPNVNIDTLNRRLRGE